MSNYYPMPVEYEKNIDLELAFEDGYNRGQDDGKQEGLEEAAREFAERMNEAIDKSGLPWVDHLHETVEKIAKIVVWGE